MKSTVRPAPAGLLTRVVGGLRSAWFGPSVPLSPEAPPDTAGRRFDYPVGFNLRLQPRQDEGTSFAELRGLADAYDLVRLVIETRKDQIEALDWQIRPRRGGSPDDPRITAIEDLLRYPDREHPWSSWVRLLLEDLFVLDAPTLYVRRTATGALWGLEVVDGATIKRLLGSDGRTPRAPDPAYQQVLKGIPAVDYTSDELIYAPRNPRPHKVYGYSPVEQILMTVNIGLRRQVSQLNYFTEGNTPEALIGVPEQWTPDQIRQFQEYWDALLEGNLAARRHTRFVPGGLKYQPIRDVPLKDDFDEWLARVVCFAFSIPPTAFSKQTNRATAESAQESATAEGLQPLLVWLKSLIDRIIGDVLGCGDLEFAWADRTAPDPQTQATIAAAYVGAGIKTRNEVRAELGLDPIAGGDTLTTATPAAPLPGAMAKAGYREDETRDQGKWATSANETNSSSPLADVNIMGDQTGFHGLIEARAASPHYTVDHGVPPDAVAYTTSDGAKFLAPPEADFEAMKAYGQSIKDLPWINQLVAIGAAVGPGGRFDVQRKGTTFYRAYTDAANFDVGVVLQGTGHSWNYTEGLAGTWATFRSSQGWTQQQTDWWRRGYDAAAANALPRPDRTRP